MALFKDVSSIQYNLNERVGVKEYRFQGILTEDISADFKETPKVNEETNFIIPAGTHVSCVMREWLKSTDEIIRTSLLIEYKPTGECTYRKVYFVNEPGAVAAMRWGIDTNNI